MFDGKTGFGCHQDDPVDLVSVPARDPEEPPDSACGVSPVRKGRVGVNPPRTKISGNTKGCGIFPRQSRQVSDSHDASSVDPQHALWR
ncbi:hypothetical protein A9G02_02135 [Cutibacterium avidum]|nr:hypothetical protein A9G02_02135 [Cutibacterium avidum]